MRLDNWSIDGVISIRAPTRGATTAAVSPVTRKIFQSALPRGERPAGSMDQTADKNFNPRSHEGSDAIDPICQRIGSISIRAPTRGATSTTSIYAPQQKFQSALPRGERRGEQGKTAIWRLFQSALPRGERHQFSPKSSLLS